MAARWTGKKWERQYTVKYRTPGGELIEQIVWSTHGNFPVTLPVPPGTDFDVCVTSTGEIVRKGKSTPV